MLKPWKHSITRAALFCAFVFVLAGSASAQSDELDFWIMPFTDNLETRMAPYLDSFEEQTGISVNLTVVSYADGLTRLQAAIAAGRGPDLAYMTDGRFMPLVDFGGALEPLSGYMDEDFSDAYVDPQLLEQYQVDGEYYAVPFGFVTYLWAINTEHFEEAGVSQDLVDRMSDPEQSWTWTDLEELFAQLTRDTDSDGEMDRWAYAYPGGSTWLHSFPLWLWSAGGSVFTEGGEVGLETDAVERALSFLKGALDAGYMPPGSESMAPQAAIDAFATGRTSIINNVWPANGLFVWPEQYPDLEYELVYPPEGPTGVRTTYFGGTLLSILTQSDNKAGAWQLVEYMLQPEFQQFLSDTGTFPVTGELSEALQERPDVDRYYDVLPWAVPEPRHPDTGVVQQVYNSVTQAVMTGQTSPEEAGQAMREQALERLNR